MHVLRQTELLQQSPNPEVGAASNTTEPLRAKQVLLDTLAAESIGLLETARNAHTTDGMERLTSDIAVTQQNAPR